ncbi:MAG TPA: hypothetical protein DCY13_16995 [Verrucomicrobiales bacterium]|nr:hypothetical protein [Verrucomicrobiales bacterium]
MNRFLSVTLLALLIHLPGHLDACIGVDLISKEAAAEEFDAAISIEKPGTELVGVRLEFTLKGRLKTFASAKLQIHGDGKQLLQAPITPSKQTPERVVIHFFIAPELVRSCTLVIYHRIEKGKPPYEAIMFEVGRFVEPE